MAFLDAVHAGAWNGHPGIERTRLKLLDCLLEGVDNGHLHVRPKVSGVHGTEARPPQEARTDAAIAGVRRYAESPRCPGWAIPSFAKGVQVSADCHLWILKIFSMCTDKRQGESDGGECTDEAA